MPSPTIPVLGAATVNRKFIYEVDTANNPAAPNWTVIGGLMNSQFQPDAPNMVGDTDQAGQGFESSTKTGATWSGSITCVRKVASVSNPTAYDTAQEFLRLASIGQFGPANTVHVRVYEYDPNDPNGTATPRVEAYSGYASVSWQPQGGDMLAEDTVQISLTGQGALNVITHPYPATAAVPVITSVSPLTGYAAAGGTPFRITGHGFTGTVSTTGVKFGGTNATSWTVWSDTEITGVAPAHSAGSGVTVVVTNATGASTTGPTVTFV
jgi:hypothetical protein